MKGKKVEKRDLDTLWNKVAELEEQVNKKTTDYERTAASASKMASEYRNRTEDARNKAKEYLIELEKWAKRYETEVKGITEITEELHNRNQESTNTLLTFQKELTEVLKIKGDVVDLIDELNEYFDNNHDISEKIERLNGLINAADEEAIKVNQILKNASSRKNEIDKLYLEIMGSDVEDEETGEETHIDGLKDELENSYENLKEKLKLYKSEYDALKNDSIARYEEIKESWNSSFGALEEEIRKLLPTALTAGLSSAYSEKKQAEERDLLILERSFKKSIWGLVLVSFIPFGVSTSMLINGDSFHETIINLPRILLSILPLYIPVLWLAYSANKKRNLSKRLIEEYTHKEVLSKTYQGLSEQIENISSQEMSSELRVKLLYNLLTVSSENPGKLISDYNNSDHPIIDALNKSSKLSDAVDRLEKLPGFKKISQILEKKAERVLEKQVSKVDDALDTFDSE